MQWWNDFVAWLLSDAARPWLFTAVVLFAAVVAAGLLSAWIARRAVRGLGTAHAGQPQGQPERSVQPGLQP